MRRLQQSSVTVNPARGRDTLSYAFESRLRVRALTSGAAHWYTPADVAAALTTTTATADDRDVTRDDSNSSRRAGVGNNHGRVCDPTSSAGSVAEQRKARAGDARAQRVLAQKRDAEAAVRVQRTWRLLVVQPVTLDAVALPVSYPSAHPIYYAAWPRDAHDVALASFAHARLERDDDAAAEATTGITTTTATRRPFARSRLFDGHDDSDDDGGLRDHVLPPQPRLARVHRYRLRKDGDTALLPGCLHCVTTKASAAAAATAETTAADDASSEVVLPRHELFYTALCVEPRVPAAQTHSTEAQTDVVTAYRNVLYEAAELPGDHVADVLRVPALATDAFVLDDTSASTTTTTTPANAQVQQQQQQQRWFAAGKLTQQALVKAFHRLSEDAKERLVMRRAFRVELYVPPALHAAFVRAFATDAWEAPSTLALCYRAMALYRHLTPPPLLQQQQRECNDVTPQQLRARVADKDDAIDGDAKYLTATAATPGDSSSSSTATSAPLTA